MDKTPLMKAHMDEMKKDNAFSNLSLYIDTLLNDNLLTKSHLTIRRVDKIYTCG